MGGYVGGIYVGGYVILDILEVGWGIDFDIDMFI